MVSIRRIVHKIFCLCDIFIVILLLQGHPCYSEIKVKVLPNETNPSEIVIENDSLFMTISLDWKLTVNSMKYKPQNMEFIQPKYSIPLVGIENRWTLFNVGFGIRNVSIQRTKELSTVLIHAYSNYLENPFHIFVQLSIGENPEIRAKIWLVNQYKRGVSDIYRAGKTNVVPEIPWIPFLSPNPGGVRKVLYPTEDG